MGVTVLMGRYIGEKNEGRLGKVIGGAIVTFLAIAAVMTVLLLVFAPGLSTVMQAPKDAIDKTIVYIRICGGGIVFIIGYNLISSIFRGIGNSRLPLLFVGIACAVNVVLDLVFVAVFRWDVAGAAFATVIAQAVSLILSVLVCTKINLPFHIRKSDLRFSGEVQKFLALGLPIAFQEFLTQFSFMCLLSFVNGMGSTEAIRLATIFRIRNCKQNRSSCNAGSICSDAVNVIFHRTECRRRERKAGAEIDGIWYADRWLHRNCHDGSCIFRWTVPCIFLYG